MKVAMADSGQIPDVCEALIVSVAGRIGSGASSVAKMLRDKLHEYRYEVKILDISRLIIGYSASGLTSEEDVEREVESFNLKFPHAKDRTKNLQDMGNSLRASGGPNVLAGIAARDFVRQILDQSKTDKCRVAIIIDSLKRPEEVSLLRALFGKSYLAVGVVASDAKRFERLRERKHYGPSEIKLLSERDRKERESDSGQRAVDTVLASDYFLSNDHSTKDGLAAETERFVSLAFRSSVTTPRTDEFAMNIAFKAAAKSACLSRQVGAAIFDAQNELLSTGCNDVPKKGGGLYTSESREDKRCWSLGGKCYNDEEKRLIVDDLVNDLSKMLIEEFPSEKGEKNMLLIADQDDLKNKLRKVVEPSRIRQLIEFTRAVHAEMDALISIARSGRQGVVGSTLYCTTYPCHNCAKHIIDAGVKRVVYLEPYEKSLARKLHHDVIDDTSSDAAPGMLPFSLYNGVSPRRYAEFFESAGQVGRKSESGKYVDRSDNKSALAPANSVTMDEFFTRLYRLLEVGKGISNGSGSNADE